MNTTTNETRMQDLLREAVTRPGILSSAYSAFHRFSILNQLSAMWECQSRGLTPGPIATFPGWKEKGRHVKRGEKAVTLCMPITRKRTEQDKETGEEREVSYATFTWRPNWFVLSQTDGAEYAEPVASPHWDRNAAIDALKVEEVEFTDTDGNCQGYAKARSFAVSPLAVLPHKTTFHELAHIALGHTIESGVNDTEQTPRSLREVEAESVAYILISILDLPGQVESRGYIQHWLSAQPIPEKSAQRIFKAADTILKAGATV
jgi:antirestriction protein ArdC